jgi:hypothetical protein
MMMLDDTPMILLAVQQLVDHLPRGERHVPAALGKDVDDELSHASSPRRPERVHELVASIST